MIPQPNSVKLLFPEIKELLAEKDYTLLKQVLRECSPIGLSDFWQKFTPEEQIQIFKLLPTGSALKLFEILEMTDQQYLLSKLGDENVAPLLENVPSPDLVKIFNQMPPRAVKMMRNLIKKQEALAHIDLLMKYPENTAGSLMHPEFIKLTPRMTAKHALSLLQVIARPNQKEHLFSLFVTDAEGHVMGSLDLQTLLAAPANEVLSELMGSVEAFKIRPEMDQEEVSTIFSKYDLSSAPVVDENNKLIGTLVVRDILAVQRSEATEDLAKMVGTQAVDFADVRENTVGKTVRYRMPWLLVTLFGELLVSFIIKSFEPVLSKVIALAAFSPLIAAMGGNVGAQSATIVVRSLALGHIKTAQEKARTIFHEVRVGISLGLLYGIFLAAVAYLIYGDRYHWEFSLAVMIGMWTSITVAATMGALEPIFFHRIGIDPATATGPLITTITDIISNLTYYSLATYLLLHLAV